MVHSSVFLLSILLHNYTTIYLSSQLLRNIWVAANVHINCKSSGGQMYSFILDIYKEVELLGDEGGCTFSFNEYCQIFFRSDCNNFYTHQQSMGGVPADLILSVFKILAILVDM